MPNTRRLETGKSKPLFRGKLLSLHPLRGLGNEQPALLSAVGITEPARGRSMFLGKDADFGTAEL